MNLMKKVLLTLFILGFICEGYSQENNEKTTKNSFTIEEAVKFAVENGYDVKSKKIDLDIAKKKIWETTAIGLPQATGTVAYQHTFKVPEMSFGQYMDPTTLPDGFITRDDILAAYKNSEPIALGVANSTNWDITVSQLIFSGEYIVGLRASKVFREMSEQNLTKSYSDIKESVSSSYFLAIVMDENLKLLKETQKVNDAYLKDLVAMGEQGLIEETGVDQVRIMKANLNNAVQSIERLTLVSKKLLKFQMGMPIENEIILTDSLGKYTNETAFTPYLAEVFDVTKTIDYQILETGVKLQKLSWDRERTTFLPSVAGFYRHFEQLNAASFNFQPKDIAGINISIPIFSSGMRTMKVQQARLNFEKMKVTQQQAIEGLNLKYQTTFNDFQTSYASYLTNKQNMQLAKKIFNQTMIKYKEGVASAMDLNTSETQYLTTQRDYFTALDNLLTAKVKLDNLLSKN